MEEKAKKSSTEPTKEHIEEDTVHRHHRDLDDMPSSYRGRGPQENTAIGYDSLEDI